MISPRSACPSCATPISAWDNVPILSWLVLHGKCRNCDSPISMRYPLIEATTAVLFAGIAARIGFSWSLPAYLVLTAGLLALACTDFEYLLLPKRIVYPVLVLVGVLLALAAAITHHWHQFLIATVCAIVWFVVFFAMNAISPRLLGFGDVRLAPVLGLALGWLGVRYALLGFFAANLLGGDDRAVTHRHQTDEPRATDPLRRLSGAGRIARNFRRAGVAPPLSVAQGRGDHDVGMGPRRSKRYPTPLTVVIQRG